jgi:hypothetical protein
MCRTSESLDVFLHPMKGKSLVAKTNVQSALTRKLVRTSEAPQAEAIIDRNTNDRFTNSYRLVHDE